jgi:hypothetical protein
MKIILNLEDLISKENITENMPTIVEIPFNKVITLEDLPRSKSALHYHLYYSDVIQKLLKEGLIKKEQVEWGDDEGKLYILTLENVEFLKTVVENSYIEKRKEWDSQKKERYKIFLEECLELWQFKKMQTM